MEAGERETPYCVLNLGKEWEFRSPGGRWETVKAVDHDSSVYFSKIWTDLTGEDFGWLLASSRRIHACPPRISRGDIVVRLIDPGRIGGVTPRLSLGLATETATFAWSDWEDLPAQAEYLGQGCGWKVTYRPHGVDDLVTEEYPDKLHAKRRMNQLARVYANAYGLKVGGEMGRD